MILGLRKPEASKINKINIDLCEEIPDIRFVVVSIGMSSKYTNRLIIEAKYTQEEYTKYWRPSTNQYKIIKEHLNV